MTASRLFIAVMLLLPLSAIAQKNVTDVSRSEITGIQLPAGAKQDKRILSTASAFSLLDMKAKELGKTVKGSAEVIYLLPDAGTKPSERVKKLLNESGYKISDVEGDKNYSLLVKGNDSWLIYLSDNKSTTDFYSVSLNPVAKTAEETQTPVQTTKTVPAASGTVQNTVAAPTATTAVTTAVTQTEPLKEKKSESVNASNNSEYTFTTTNFNDGWTSTIASDYVNVAKGDLSVRLYYTYRVTEDMRPPASELSDYFWNLLVPPSFDIKNATRFVEGITYFNHYYIYGDAVDRSTGKNCYIGLNVLVSSGIASPLLAIAPDRQTYEKQFPHPDSIARMTGYNRFAISLKDLTGTWTGSDGAVADYYNSVTGNYVGMAFASSSDEFSFASSGDYSSKHTGASGMVGNMTTYNQEYKGKSTVSNWEMILPNRWKGQTDTFEAWFEAVRGGRLLKLVNKQYTGIRYTLVRKSKE